MPDDDDRDDDPFRNERRSRPDGKGGGDIFREDRAREQIEKSERERPKPRSDEDDD